jgi:hypothetical protein
MNRLEKVLNEIRLQKEIEDRKEQMRPDLDAYMAPLPLPVPGEEAPPPKNMPYVNLPKEEGRFSKLKDKLKGKIRK